MSVFERFTQAARNVVIGGRRVASAGRASEIRNDHLMVALLQEHAGVGVRVLASAGLTEADRAALLDDFATLNRRAGVSGADADALREIGIDVDEVLDRMDELLAEPETQPEPSARQGFVRFSADAKRTLERSLREALDLRDKHIDDGHILLALVSRPGVVAEALNRYGVTYADVRRAVCTRADAG